MATLPIIPMAASGQPAPVTLVEVMTRFVPGPPAPPIVPDNPPPDPPRSLNPGEVLGWSYATVPATASSNSEGPSVFNGFSSVSTSAGGTRTSGFLSISGSDPIGLNTVATAWSGFQRPAGMPAGATIVDVYAVIVTSAVEAGADMTFSCGGLDFGVAVGNNYGGNIGTWAGQVLSASIINTVGGADVLSITISFAALAVIYTLPPAEEAVEGEAGDALAGGIYFWSEHRAIWPSIITGQPALFLDWLTGPQQLHQFGSTQTDTAAIAVQNISGNTVERDAALAFARTELIGALVVVRIWRGDAETPLLTFIGNIVGVDMPDASLRLKVEGFGNWSAIAGLPYDIDPACGLTFGSKACGSTSPTPCDQTFGNCSSINRFMGMIGGWIEETPNTQLAQPAPTVQFNPKRPF